MLNLEVGKTYIDNNDKEVEIVQQVNTSAS